MTAQAISPLRRRMIEDMTIRKLAPKTGEREPKHQSRAPARHALSPTDPAAAWTTRGPNQGDVRL